MAEGTGKLIGRLINLVLLIAIVIGAWYGYQRYYVGPRQEAEMRSKAIALLGEQKWDEALAELDKLDKVDKFKPFVKEQRFICYQGKANNAYTQATKAESKFHKYKKTDAQKAADSEAEMKRLFQQTLDLLETTEKYGRLKRLDIMNRSGSYMSLGDKEAAKKWSRELKNYQE
jgi:hypothetical protein